MTTDPGSRVVPPSRPTDTDSRGWSGGHAWHPGRFPGGMPNSGRLISGRGRGLVVRIELLADRGGDLSSKELDGSDGVRVRERTHADLPEEPLVAEDLVLAEDLVDHLLRAAHQERAGGRAQDVELGSADPGPSSLRADPVHHRRVRGEELVGGPLRRLRDVRVRVDPERELRLLVTGPAP